MSENAPTPAAVGRRQIVTYNTTGQPSYATQELTAADFLNPQPGDEYFHGEAHDALVDYLAGILRHLYRYNPSIGVLARAKVLWEDPALAQPMPDIAVVPNLTDPHRYRARLDVAAEGVSPRCIIEITSPLLAHIDLEDKRDLYARAQVEEYIIVRPAPLAVTIFRLEDGRYQPAAAEGGRVFSAANKLWFLPQAGGHLTVIEARTGRTLTPPDEEIEPAAAAQIDAALRAQSIASQLNWDR